MAITASQAQGLILTLFGASAGAHLTGLLSATNLSTLAGDAVSTAGLVLGRNLSSDAAFRDLILTENLGLTGTTLTEAQAWMDGEFTKGTSRADIVAAVVTYLEGLTDTTNTFYAAAAAYRASVADAVAWSEGAGATIYSVATLREQQGHTETVVGASFTLTTGTDTLIGTAGNDTFTGVSTTYSDNDRVIDSSSADNDTYNLTIGDDATPDVVNVENINITTASTTSVIVDAGSIIGMSHLKVTPGNLSVGGSTITGGKAVDINNLTSSSALTVTVGSGASTVNIDQQNGAGATINADTASGGTTVLGAATVSAAGAGVGDTVTVQALSDADASVLGTASAALVVNALPVSVTTNAAAVLIDDNGINKFTGAISVNAPAVTGATALVIDNATGGATVTAGTTGTADLTIAINNIDDSGATITTGTGARQTTTAVKEITINLDGTSALADTATVKGDGYIALDTNTTDQVENLTLSGSTVAVTYAIAGTDTATRYTLSGDYGVTLRGNSTAFNLVYVTDSLTTGASDLYLSTVGAADLSRAATDTITLAADGAGGDLIVTSGANIVLKNDQTGLQLSGKAAGATLNIATADDTAAS